MSREVLRAKNLLGYRPKDDLLLRTFLLLSPMLVARANVALAHENPLGEHAQGQDKATFKAAVYEHRPFMPNPLVRPTVSYAKSILMKNLEVYEQQARIASQQGAKILVFPEDGLYGMIFSSRDSIFPYLELVPDPELYPVDPYNPCQELSSDNRTVMLVQYTLSCMSKANSLYIVANAGSYVPCSRDTDPLCPGDGRYQYNTNLIFDTKGNLIGRYYKQVLYYETYFDTPKEVKHTIVDTPFGRFGTLICFDVLFKPAIDLAEQGIDGVLFSTAWMNEMPFMQAVAIHSAWALRMGLNFISAEIHEPVLRFWGSGLYAGAAGASGVYNDNGIFSKPKLVVAEVPVRPPQPLFAAIPLPPERDNICGNFKAEMEGNIYTFSPLCSNRGEIFLKTGSTKCHLLYDLTSGKELIMEYGTYAMAVFDGLHVSAHNSYIQVCAVVHCRGKQCGRQDYMPQSVLTSVKLTGQFTTPYVFPSTFFTDGSVRKAAWEFAMDNGTNVAKISMEGNARPVYTVALYGRLYDLDSSPPDEEQANAGKQIVQMQNSVPLSGEQSESYNARHSLKFELIIGLTSLSIGLVILAGIVLMRVRSPRGTDRSQYISI